MKTQWIKQITLAAAAATALMGTALYADNNTSPKSSTVKETTTQTHDVLQLIDIAGRQRMLSQRIAKDYLYAGEKVAVSKAQKQLAASLKSMVATHKTLVNSINDPEIKNLLAFVELSMEDFKSTANEPFNLDNAQLIIDLSESMLEGSQYVVNSLKKKANLKESALVGKAGRQRMLAQRIAKYYIAYQAGIRDKNTVDQMKEAVKEFSDAHKALMNNPSNTPEINRKLNKINRLWKIVYKFYLNIEKGGLPLIVFNTTDDITNKMNQITELYVALSK
ncbi:type IV pili methyl-accepting chemotaxis transducer N-terminal domain-containing protein [Sulfurovum sp.]|uniref:type IV pili methyl-accepting chemotaxis transducer N-terminal domain-containing protein n=1 Tax=Sulfurovum sp. TaxID=1969726 RepID=UPI0025D0BA2C|nr:type IV pili methyl-accepting chemotaxis transducer N-terminal domain-containing protein [Sulfurovum sp.]